MPYLPLPRLPPDLVILSLRGTGLLLKLGLAVFIAHYMGMASVAHYGYIAAAAAILPIAFGFGMIQDLGRQLVTSGLPAIAPALRCYWRCLVALYLAAALVLVMLPSRAFELPPAHLALAVAILLLEHLNNDAYFIIGSQQRPLLAVLFPALRSTPVLMGFWLGGLCLAWSVFLVSCPGYRSLGARHPSERCLIDLRGRFRRNMTLYLGEAANASAVHVDRYVVGLALGHVAAGVYVLFSSVATGIYTLVNTAVMQVARPQLVAHHAGTQRAQFRRVHASALRRTVLLGAGIALMAAATLHLALPHFDQPQLALHEPTLHVLLLATILRAASDMQGYVFYTQRLDRLFLYTALFTVTFYLAASAVLLPLAGLVGAAAAVACAFAATLVLRSGLVHPRAMQ
jgi:hypothetical protein